ncbi:hypothetical protein [Anaeromyxobacter dehalogenans]|nr:hypothetical protein [Anaeromyxobacter dehalogenans]
MNGDKNGSRRIVRMAPPCPNCGCTRQRRELRSYRPDAIDPRLRGVEPDARGFITRCPACGAQGLVDTKECKACGDTFEYVVSAWNCRPRRFCEDPDCRRERHRVTMQRWRVDQARRNGR